jgi:hypothetical protein
VPAIIAATSKGKPVISTFLRLKLASHRTLSTGHETPALGFVVVEGNVLELL